MFAILSLVYRALAPIHLFAPAIGEMEVWQVGVLLGADDTPPPPRLIIPREPVDPDGPRPTGPRLAEVD